jgi:hypothetical protein
MIWRGIGLLVGAAALVVMGVAALALVVVPDEPRFSDAFEEETDIEEDFVPDALGARLTISGARSDTVVLDDTVGGPTFGLGNSRTRIFFEGDPIGIGQMSHDGLAFFPQPEDCEFTPGEHNEEAGLIAVRISCPDLVDIRDNGSITLEGIAALPADLVTELDLPEFGGVLTVGEEEWDIVDPVLIVGPGFRGGGAGELGLALNPDEPEKGMFLSYDLDSGRLSPGTLLYDGTVNELKGVACFISDETIMVVNPQAEVNELTLDCDDVEIDGLGPIDIGGTIVYQKLYMTEG